MATSKLIIYITAFLNFCIVSTNGQGYSFIKNATVNSLYTKLGYKPNDVLERWDAEGDAIYSALNYIDTLEPGVLVRQDGIEFIVGTTGDNTSTYIAGLAKRIGHMGIGPDQIPSQIIIVYTLNYISKGAAAEYANFKQVLKYLTAAVDSKKHVKEVKVVVKNFRPVTNKHFELVILFDYPEYNEVKMEPSDETAQKKVIEDLHASVDIPVDEIINAMEFKTLLSNWNINKIVDGVMGSVKKPTTKSNQLLLAIAIGQIHIMSEAIATFKKGAKGVIVICNDNPSGMDEDGKWTICMPFPADFILSCVWHKKLVNSADLLGNTRAIVLDITFRSTRLLVKLRTMINDAILIQDVDSAIKLVQTGVITFNKGNPPTRRMVVAPH